MASAEFTPGTLQYLVAHSNLMGADEKIRTIATLDAGQPLDPKIQAALQIEQQFQTNPNFDVKTALQQAGIDPSHFTIDPSSGTFKINKTGWSLKDVLVGAALLGGPLLGGAALGAFAAPAATTSAVTSAGTVAAEDTGALGTANAFGAGSGAMGATGSGSSLLGVGGAASGAGGAASGAGGAASGAGGAGASSGIGSWLGPLLGAGTSALGSILQSQGENQRFEESRQDTQKQLIAQYLSSLQNQNVQTGLTQAAQGLQATQMNPYQQAMDLNKANVQRSFSPNMNTGSMGSLDLSALDPSNLQSNANYFYKNVAAAQPNVPLTDVNQTADQFRQQYLSSLNTNQQNMMNQIMQYLQQIGKAS